MVNTGWTGDDGTVYIGELVAWREDRGYGFLRPIGAGRDADVFVHGSALADSARVLGARLRFAIVRTDRGPRAAWTALIEDAAG